METAMQEKLNQTSLTKMSVLAEDSEEAEVVIGRESLQDSYLINYFYKKHTKIST
jgi:hypothetical protein